MSANGIGVPSPFMTDISKTGFKDIKDLGSYDMCCDAPESRIQMEIIPDKLEEDKPFKEEVDMACDWVARNIWNHSTRSTT